MFISTLCKMACTPEDIIAFLTRIPNNRMPPDVNGNLQKWYPRVQDVVGAIVHNTSNGRQIYADFCASPTRLAFLDIDTVIGRAAATPFCTSVCGTSTCL
jgi:hypothetical protein